MNNPSQKDLHSLEKAVIPIVKKSGQYVLDNWTKIQTKKLKDERDVVTNVDFEVESSLRESLHKLLPEAGFTVEEGKSELKGDLTWAIDPIDGTKNYAFSYPLFSVQIALIYKNNPILGIVYNPISSQLFSASSGNGSKLNSNLIKVIAKTDLKSAIVDVDFGGNDSIIDWKLAVLGKLAKQVFRIRMTGGFASSYLLTGAFDATVYLHQQPKDKYIVDNAPRIVLLQEAGFSIVNLNLENNVKVFMASHAGLVEKLKELF